MTSKQTVAMLAAALGQPYDIPYKGNVSHLSAAEVAVGLALVIVAYRLYKNIDIANFRSLKG